MAASWAETCSVRTIGRDEWFGSVSTWTKLRRDGETASDNVREEPTVQQAATVLVISKHAEYCSQPVTSNHQKMSNLCGFIVCDRTLRTEACLNRTCNVLEEKLAGSIVWNIPRLGPFRLANNRH
jgi:hypothetical protein